ncbi:uncharacterized protein Rv2226/MT2285 [Arthrobacter sp. Hiyo4]|nr:uncharacterized protein Rv2226/MT2285 [Arthrobacter sp. Hiyo4]
MLAYLRGEDAAPVVRLKTRRTTYALYGEDGVHLADLADDRVSAELLGAAGGAGDAAAGDTAAPEGEARTRQWREWELELVHGSPELFPAAEEILAAAGALPAKHGSKLAKVLALPAKGPGAAAGPKSPGPKSPGKKGPVSDLLAAYLAGQISEILAHDPGVRLEEPEAVHDLRSATRRARSALQAYRQFYNSLAVRHLGTELKWLGRVLGVPRDAEVMLDRLRGHMAGLPPVLASAVKDRLEDDLGASRDAAHRKLQMAMVSARYFQLLDDLEAFLDNPPVRPGAAAPARKAAAKLVAKAAKRLERAARTAKRTGRGPSTRRRCIRCARTPSGCGTWRSPWSRSAASTPRKSPRPRAASSRSSEISTTAWWPGTCWPSWRRRRTCPRPSRRPMSSSIPGRFSSRPAPKLST